MLDSLAPDQVLHCNTEKECSQLVRLLPPTDAALLDWAINLMADVVEHERYNKMNARNIAMVFAPNMTQVRERCHIFLVLNKKKVDKLTDVHVYRDPDGRSIDCIDPCRSGDELPQDINYENPPRKGGGNCRIHGVALLL